MTKIRRIDTLIFVFKDNNVLLGYKKRGFGQNKWVGFGGKVEKNEQIEDCAKRELFEECNLVANELKKVGILLFKFVNDPMLLEVHVFVTDNYSGDICETEEMIPKWFPVDSLPYDKMWADDIYWLPQMIKGTNFTAYFKYEGLNKILEYNVIKKLNNETIEPIM